MDDRNSVPPPYSSRNPLPDPYPQPISWKFSDDEVFPVLNEPANDDREAVRMGKFKAFVFKAALLSFKNKFLSPKLRSLIEKRIDEFFPDFHTPDHPPYAAMISTAITKLNEDGGSTAEAISQFIQNEYTHLPRAHEYFLKHHLKNLCAEGVLGEVGKRFYVLDHDVVTEGTPERSCRHSQSVVSCPDLSPISPADDKSNSSLISSSSSWNSNGSWGSNTSFDRSHVPKREPQSSRGKKRVSKRETKHSHAVKRMGTKGKKVTMETEIELNAERKRRKCRQKDSRCSLVQKSAREGGKKRKSSSTEASEFGKKTGKGDSLNANIVMLEGEIKLQEQATDGQEVGQYSEGQAKGRKLGRKNKRTIKETQIHLECEVTRQNTVCGNTKIGKEILGNSDVPILKDGAKESEERTDGKVRHHAVVECRDPVTGERRTVIDIDLDELQDMVNEEPCDLPERSAKEDYNQAGSLESQVPAQSDGTVEKELGFSPLKQTKMISTFELHQMGEAKVAGKEYYVADEQRETAAKDKQQLIVKESFVRDTNSGEQSLLQEFGFDIVKGKLKNKKKRFHPCKKNVRGEKVHSKDRAVRGRGKHSSGQCTKNLSVEPSQSQTQMSEAISTEDLSLEKSPEVTQQQTVVNQNEFQGNECDNSVCCQAEDFNTEIQNGTPSATVEVHESSGQPDLLMEGESHVLEGVAGCDDEQQEHGTLMHRKGGSIGMLTNEVSEAQSEPQRMGSGEQNHQIVKLSGSNTMQQSNPLAEEQGALGKVSALGHDAKENSYNEGTALARESVSLEFERETENTSRTNTEKASECLEEEETINTCGRHTQQKSEFLSPESSSKFPSPNFLPQYGQQHENEEEEMPKYATEQKGEGPGEEGNEDIGSQDTQTEPHGASSQCAELKSQEISSQPQSLLPHAKATPQGKFWHWFLKPFNFSC